MLGLNLIHVKKGSQISRNLETMKLGIKSIRRLKKCQSFINIAAETHVIAISPFFTSQDLLRSHCHYLLANRNESKFVVKSHQGRCSLLQFVRVL